MKGKTKTLLPFLARAPWTLCLTAFILVANLGVFPGMPQGASVITGLLELDREAVGRGEVWRLLTGNLVHWSPAHLWLDAGAFLFVGLLFERHLGKAYPWILLGSALAVGLGVLFLGADVSVYRGLSGVDSGQFAAALLREFVRARDPGELLPFLLAALIFAAKLTYEGITGEWLFGGGGLGDLGIPVPISHIAGTLGALGVLLTSLPRAHHEPWFRAAGSRRP